MLSSSDEKEIVKLLHGLNAKEGWGAVNNLTNHRERFIFEILIQPEEVLNNLNVNGFYVEISFSEEKTEVRLRAGRKEKLHELRKEINTVRDTLENYLLEKLRLPILFGHIVTIEERGY